MIRPSIIAGALLIAPAMPAHAGPTEVVVRVISQDAKFVGESMGGASVVLSDARTGEQLAAGVTSGTTGDTALIMQASGRSPHRSSDGAAAFRTTITIDRPTLVRVDVRGPLGYPDTIQAASSERWLIPDQTMSGTDGWVVELPGLAIRLIEPLPATVVGHPVALVAHVQLMCGCPITPGGLWDAADYAVTAEIRAAGAPIQRLPMHFAASPGQFAAEWVPAATGDTEILIIAHNIRTGNTGVLSHRLRTP